MRFFTISAALLIGSIAALAADVAGTWQLVIDTPNGRFESTVDMKQTGEKLSGVVHNQFGDSEISGTVKDAAIEFSQKLDFNGRSMTISYSGKVESPTKLSGKFKFGDQGEGDWSATKK